MASTTESAATGIAKGIAPYLILAGILGVVYLKRDQIASWLSNTITKPVTGAISDTWGAVTSPFVSAGHSAGQWWYETTNQDYKQAMADQAYVTNQMATHDTHILDDIVSAKTEDQWLNGGPGGLSFTIIGQNGMAGVPGGPAEATDPAITYTSAEMSTMSKGITTDPGTGFVVRGQSLTGADLFKVGPWTKVGIVTINDPSGPFTNEVWKNPVDGALEVRDAFGGRIGYDNFQRIERQYGRGYTVEWL